MSHRSAGLDELKEKFYGVDTDVLWDLMMADIVSSEQGWSRLEITDNVAMFGFIMRRLFPATVESDD